MSGPNVRETKADVAGEDYLVAHCAVMEVWTVVAVLYGLLTIAGIGSQPASLNNSLTESLVLRAM